MEAWTLCPAARIADKQDKQSQLAQSHRQIPPLAPYSYWYGIHTYAVGAGTAVYCVTKITLSLPLT